ncbi:helix-turn-helix domain-containing protein [Gemmatimonas sp.]|uniref:helix-turn-helix domain-containing protein n=1 Tax=Gemmatimonas sp. TaxID=1962908 RepID=UPI003F70E037
MLALRFTMRVAAELGKKIDGLSPDALEALQQYPWPGNVRELQHVIERAVILTPDPLIQPHCLEGTRFGLAHSLGAPNMRPRAFATPGMSPMLAVSGAAAAPAAAGAAGTAGGGNSGGIALNSLNVADAERVLIQHALQAADNNRTKAAELLGISVRTLRNKLNGPGKDGDEE